MTDWEFCSEILPDVSRTFALGIRILPRDLSKTVALAYLICRIADTIEDDTRLSVAQRRDLLAQLRQALAGERESIDEVESSWRSPAENNLMHGAHRVLAEFRRLPAADQGAVVPWVVEMVDGMATSLSAGDVREPLLDSIADLREYCYFVAGTVGHMLTGLFALHVRGIGATRKSGLAQLATNFGLALQLTNVIRDVGDDHREGRNLIPRALWRDAGIEPAQMLKPGHETASRKVLDPLLEEAQRCLEDAFRYSSMLPRSAVRVRLFCFSQLFFASRTLSLVRSRFGEMSRGVRIKMPRREIYMLSLLTFVCAPSNRVLALIFGALSSGRAR